MIFHSQYDGKVIKFMFQTTNQYTQFMLKYSNIKILDQQHETSMSDFRFFVGSSECDLKIFAKSLKL